MSRHLEDTDSGGEVTHTHGHAGKHRSGAYRSWAAMKQRVLYRGHVARRYYADRGIGVCESWMFFENFLADMGDRPKGMTLDREDNSKGYSRNNCRWVDRKTQRRNNSFLHPITFNGKTMLMRDWAKQIGISETLLGARVGRLGWSIERALTTGVVRRPE